MVSGLLVENPGLSFARYEIGTSYGAACLCTPSDLYP